MTTWSKTKPTEPDAIEAAKDALREAAQRAERTEGEERLAAIYRAAFAKLDCCGPEDRAAPCPKGTGEGRS